MSVFLLPKVVLKLSPINERSEEPSITYTKNAAKLHEVLRTSAVQTVNEMHQNRMKNLRKDLEYLKETEWTYEPVEKYIGQGF